MKKMKRPNYSHFSDAPQVMMPRSAFDMSFTYKTTFDSGYIVPIMQPIEILPGDTCNLDLQSFMRLSTPVVPFMDNLYCRFFFFFVPNRLVLTHWPEVNGAREDPYDPDTDVEYTVPYISSGQGGFAVGSLADYFGIPPGVGLHANVLPFRAYNLIYNEWFRPADLIESAVVNLGDSDESDMTIYPLRRRAKRPDYFTRCLPWPQRGPSMAIPVAGQAPVYGTGNPAWLVDGNGSLTVFGTTSASPTYMVNGSTAEEAIGSAISDVTHTGGQGALGFPEKDLLATGDESLYADLEEAAAVSINTLRTAWQIQRLYEADARSGGNRYIEILRAHFGVISPDARLQRPEYLGGGVVPVHIHSVTQTSATDNVTPQGNLAAIGLASGLVGFRKSFVEHGFILGLACVYQDYTYQQGLHRMWSRRSRFDYYWPTLAHLGEQPVYRREIDAANPSYGPKHTVFGYQERYAEYRYGVSQITGKLRSGITGSLDVWHLAQYLDHPVLGKDFIEENPPVSRVLAVHDEPQFIYDSVVRCNMVRPMPVYAVPGLVDHF